MSTTRSNYPEWVLKYKEKGTFVNKTTAKDGTVSYYLYRGHSERVKGTKKVRRIVDECIGKITEKDGLIPAKHHMPDSLPLAEFGRTYLCTSLTERIHWGLCNTYGDKGGQIYVCSVLAYVFGTYSDELYRRSWISIRFPGMQMPETADKEFQSGLARGTAMVRTTMEKELGDSLLTALALSSLVCLIKVKGALECTQVPEELVNITKEQGIDWRKESWQK